MTDKRDQIARSLLDQVDWSVGLRPLPPDAPAYGASYPEFRRAENIEDARGEPRTQFLPGWQTQLHNKVFGKPDLPEVPATPLGVAAGYNDVALPALQNMGPSALDEVLNQVQAEWHLAKQFGRAIRDELRK